MLDEAEFGEVAKGSEYDEERINAATELGFLVSTIRENSRHYTVLMVCICS